MPASRIARVSRSTTARGSLNPGMRFIMPPGRSPASNTVTGYPRRASSRAAASPAGPAPMIGHFFGPARLRRNRRIDAALHLEIENESLQRADRDRLVVFPPRARRLAGPRADPPADPGERISLADEGERLGEPAVRNERDVSPRVDARRAGERAGRSLERNELPGARIPRIPDRDLSGVLLHAMRGPFFEAAFAREHRMRLRLGAELLIDLAAETLVVERAHGVAQKSHERVPARVLPAFPAELDHALVFHIDRVGRADVRAGAARDAAGMIDAERGFDLPPDASLREPDRVRADDLRADAHAETAEYAVVVRASRTASSSRRASRRAPARTGAPGDRARSSSRRNFRSFLIRGVSVSTSSPSFTG